MKNYRWGFSLEDLILGVGYNGPAVMGLDWMTGMMNTNSKGFISATGQVEGGHCILCRAVNIKGKFFTLRNSWGDDWGKGGDCYIPFDDMEYLLNHQGESCFFIDRKKEVR
jgi:hypothetical protein